MRAIVDIKTSELEVTLSFFQIGGYATTSEVNSAVNNLQEQIDSLEERTKAVEEDLDSRTFG